MKSVWPGIFLFLLFVKIGTVSVGGAYSIWAIIHQELASGEPLSHKLPAEIPPLSQESLQFFMQVAHLTPGPNISGVLLIGDHYLGLPGLFLVFIALLSPSVFFMVILYRLNQRWGLNRFFQAFKNGALAAIVGVLIYFLFQLSGNFPRQNLSLTLLFFAQVVLALYLIRYKRLNGILVTAFSGFISWGIYSLFLSS